MSAESYAPFRDYERRVRETLLGNGLKVLLLPRHTVPLFSFRTYVNAGSADESAPKTGIAHLFEHMAFKGSPEIGTRDYRRERALIRALDQTVRNFQKSRAKNPSPSTLRKQSRQIERLKADAARLVIPNQFSLILEQHGGIGINAFTSPDSTQYFYALPQNKLELWAYLESERFAHPVFREFYTERDVVLEERRQYSENSPTGRFYEAFLEFSFPCHPYGRPTIGYRDDLLRLTIADASAFFRRFYVARNIVVAVVGDVSENDLHRLAHRYLSRIPKGLPNPGIPPVEDRTEGEKTLKLQDSAQPMLLMGYRVPPFKHPDRHAIEAGLDILAGGLTSRLYRRLVKKDQKAVALEAFTLPGSKYPFIAGWLLLPAPGIPPQDLVPLVDEELNALVTNGATPEELKKFQARSLSQFVLSLRTNFGLAGMLTFFEVVGGGWRNLFTEMDRIRALSLAEVNHALNRYFGSRFRTIGILETAEKRSGGFAK